MSVLASDAPVHPMTIEKFFILPPEMPA